MSSILACIDESPYTNSVYQLSAWAAKQLQLPVAPLHVAQPHHEMAAQCDLSGAIGLGAKSAVRDTLTQVEEAHGKHEQAKGQQLLLDAQSRFEAAGIATAPALHRRGDFAETLQELAPTGSLLVMGKSGESHTADTKNLGANIETLARTLTTPLLIAPQELRPIRRILLAYDASPSAQKVLDFISKTNFLDGLECHVLHVGATLTDEQTQVDTALRQLKSTQLTFATEHLPKQSPADTILAYAQKHSIDMLCMGAYGHGKIHQLLLGSTTRKLLEQSTFPVLLSHA